MQFIIHILLYRIGSAAVGKREKESVEPFVYPIGGSGKPKHK
ncbi:hypothetical protein [uncultured Alistipes sp.]|nr:hypothetical protein [uncultured Alistipes sp.]